VRSHTFYIPISRYGLWDDHSVRVGVGTRKTGMG